MSKFRADCSRCCGLCCVVPDQTAQQGFAVDKPADTPCVHLTEKHRCAIYGNRTRLGYPACTTFECFGAGQWVSENLFGSADWKRSPKLAIEMFAAYRHWLPRFRAAALIEAALPHVRDSARASLVARMITLVSRDVPKNQLEPDAHRLQADTLTMIREALGPVGDNDKLR